ncbi:MAG: hypothetical protein ACI8S6_003780 [Myxococcota bacterium]|jgi:hypothetical protein
MPRPRHATLNFIWDAFLVATFAAITLAMPEMFPGWMALCALPLLACRARLSSLEAQLR